VLSEPAVGARETDDVVEAVLLASRALVAVAARSLAPEEGNVTIPQFRALVVLGLRGPQSAGDLAGALGVHVSTLTRLIDRLEAKGLINRTADEESLTARGRRVVRRVTDRRRDDIGRIVARIPVDRRDALVVALQAFGDAAGEFPDAALYEWLDE
jgi:DNA-binding MarR family transcriptional regulator